MKRRTLLISFAFFLLGAGGRQEEASKKDLEMLQGDWAGVSMIQDGMKLPDDDAQAYFRSYKGDKYAVFRYSQPLAKWTFTLDAAKKPKTIDAQREGDDKGKPALGIYEFEGGKLKLCVAGIGKERPTKFESKPGSGHTLSVWEREKKGGKV
jgi:uncharacterized protein (TIGR03067 family)